LKTPGLVETNELQLIYGTMFDLEAVMEGSQVTWKLAIGLRFGGMKKQNLISVPCPVQYKICKTGANMVVLAHFWGCPGGDWSSGRTSSEICEGTRK
jgi:hypothetical protein